MPANCSLRPPRHPYLPTWPMSLLLATKPHIQIYQNIVPGRELIIEAKNMLYEQVINYDFD